MKVLVLDDSQSNCDAMRAALEDLGHDVFVAARVHEALRLLVAERPDAAVVDLLLLNGNGFEVIADFKREGCPCILWTGLALPEGFDSSTPRLGKPFDLDELRAALEAVRK